MELPEQVPGAERSQFTLLKTRRFLPFFLTQFLGAFNDNLFRNAVIVSITFGASVAAGHDAGMLANLAQGLFILPFFLFSALSGQLADKYEKSRLIRQTRLAEVVLMCCGAVALYFGDIPSLLMVIFLLGVLATIFGPLKYSLMPQHLRQSELVGGNALVDAGTFHRDSHRHDRRWPARTDLAGGSRGGGASDANLAAAVTMVAVAVVMYLCSRAIPRAEATDPALKINFNPITSTFEVIRFAAKTRAIFLSLARHLVVLARGRADPRATARLRARRARRRQDGVHAVAGGVFDRHRAGLARLRKTLRPQGGDRPRAAGLHRHDGVPARSVLRASGVCTKPAQRSCRGRPFLHGGGWDVVLDCALIGMFGGLFIVPLYALILQRSAESHRARIIACNNIMNAGFMVVAAVLAIVWLEVLRLHDPAAVHPRGGAERARGGVHLHAGSRVPHAVPVVDPRERHVSHQGARAREHSRDRSRADRLQPRELHGPAGDRRQRAPAGALRDGSQHLQDPGAELHLPHRARDSDRAGARGRRRLQKAFDRIDAELADGEIVCIFPEGKLTKDGELNEFKKGVEKILERRPVPVVPMALRGLWGSFFSRRDGKTPMTPAAAALLVAHRSRGDRARARRRRQRHRPAEDRRRPARRVAVMGSDPIC